MRENEEIAISGGLREEDAGRDRGAYCYTYDALPHLLTWPESHKDIEKVISGKMNYDNLPFDQENEAYKGFAFQDQVVIVEANQGK